MTLSRSPLIYCFFIFFLAQAGYYFLHAGYGSTFHGAFNIIGTASGAVLTHFKEHFWQSLFYYHLLPTGYIAYAYGFNILFPPDGQLGFYILHTVLGLWTVGSMYKILERLSVNKIISITLITLFILSPAFNLYQSMGWYDFPTACLLIISTWRMARFSDEPTFKNGFIFFLTIAMLCSVRSMYHVMLYFVPLIFMSLIVFRKHYKIILLSALIPFLLVFGMYFKNYILYKTFSVNSYSGENISMITMQWNFPLKYRYEGIKKGYFSDLALCMQSSDTIGDRVPENFAYGGTYCYKVIAQKYRDNYIKKLGTDYKEVGILQPLPGQVVPHRSQLGNIGMDLEYARNAKQALIHYPSIYFMNTLFSWRYYFCDSVSYFYENMQNARHLPNWIPYRASTKSIWPLSISLPFLMLFGICYLCLSSRKLIIKFLSIYFTLSIFSVFYYHGFTCGGDLQILIIMKNLILMLAMIFIVLLHNLIERLRKTTINVLDSTSNNIILFILCNIAFSTIIMNYFAGNEQQRYRFYVTGLFFILLAVFMQFIFHSFKERYLRSK